MQKAILTKEHFTSSTTERYLSLDVLRGMTIALMIVVNTPGSWQHIYAPFRHAAWHGFTVTDLVFPMFLFVIGNAMSFSIGKYAEKGNSAVMKKIFKRAGIIFLLGLFLNLFPFVFRSADGALLIKDFGAVRIMGVLQRIALCYLIAGVIIHYFKLRGAVIFGVCILFFYWAVMWIFGDDVSPYSLEGNAALKFDLLIFSEINLYHGFGIPFDPEGLLSTLPAVVNIIGGYLAGIIIQKKKSLNYKILLFSAAGAMLVVLGLVWDTVFPINKPIWTSSYVVYTIGWSLLVLVALMCIIEKLNLRRWTLFFEVFGKNPLFIYIMSSLLIQALIIIRVGGVSLNGWIYQNLFLSWTDGEIASLLFAVSYTFILWLIGFWMMKNRIYIKV